MEAVVGAGLGAELGASALNKAAKLAHPAAAPPVKWTRVTRPRPRNRTVLQRLHDLELDAMNLIQLTGWLAEDLTGLLDARQRQADRVAAVVYVLGSVIMVLGCEPGLAQAWIGAMETGDTERVDETSRAVLVDLLLRHADGEGEA